MVCSNYSPDIQAQGDCRNCGQTYLSHFEPSAVSNAFFPYRKGYPIDLSDCDILREAESPWLITIKERLDVDAPASAKAHCCYIGHVIFYEHPTRVVDGNHAAHARLDTRLILEDVIHFEGEVFVCYAGNVVHEDGRWVSVTKARRRSPSHD